MGCKRILISNDYFPAWHSQCNGGEWVIGH
jgi:hypothetical protein